MILSFQRALCLAQCVVGEEEAAHSASTRGVAAECSSLDVGIQQAAGGSSWPRRRRAAAERSALFLLPVSAGIPTIVAFVSLAFDGDRSPDSPRSIVAVSIKPPAADVDVVSVAINGHAWNAIYRCFRLCSLGGFRRFLRRGGGLFSSRGSAAWEMSTPSMGELPWRGLGALRVCSRRGAGAREISRLSARSPAGSSRMSSSMPECFRRSFVALRTSRMPLPTVLMKSGSRLGPRTIRTTTANTNISPEPIPNIRAEDSSLVYDLKWKDHHKATCAPKLPWRGLRLG